MFYDLNVPWKPADSDLPRTLAFLSELGYNVVALNHSISGKLPPEITNPIPDPLPQTQNLPRNLTILRRITLTLTESHQNARLAALSKVYDILALRPVDERTLQLACSSLDCDIISLDLSVRLPFFFKHKMLKDAVKAGKRLELCYSQGVLGDASMRRNVISNATQLIRASRGRGLVISSETKAGAVGCRGPWDAINLAAIWGLGQERGFEAMGKEARSVVVSAKLKRTGYRGVVDVVYGGEKPVEVVSEVGQGTEKKQEGGQKQQQHHQQQQGQKRKADAVEGSDSVEKPLSKRQAKKLAHQARLQAAAEIGTASPTTGSGAENSAQQASAVD